MMTETGWWTEPKRTGNQQPVRLLCLCVAIVVCVLTAGHAGPREDRARRVLRLSGVRGGLVVHVGCGDGRFTAGLAPNDSYRVHALDTDREDVEAARRYLKSRNLYGTVSVDEWDGESLPYRDNLVNLLVCEGRPPVSGGEIMRVLCPGGVACIKRGDEWTTKRKPRPEGMDEWTHYLHDAGGNPVSQDTGVGPPGGLQWVGSPRWGRHHDHMASMNALVSSGGRIFYVIDKGSRKSILLPSHWYLVARDAFNGTVLWERSLPDWHTPLWPLKSGPAQLPRRLVAVGDRVYVIYGEDGPVKALDAATGETVRTYENTTGAQELVVSDGILHAVVKSDRKETEYTSARDVTRRVVNEPWWSPGGGSLMAFRAGSGKLLWEQDRTVVPLTLAVGDGRLCFHDGERVVCLEADTGSEVWKSRPLELPPGIYSFFGPCLALHGDVVLFAGGETAGRQFENVHRVKTKEDTLTALSLETGKVMWEASHPASGYRSPEDVFAIGDTVWCGESAIGRLEGVWTGRDVATGEVRKKFAPDVETYWFHHRCYRGKATVNYLLLSRTGIEFVDPGAQSWNINHWVRGSCLYGVMPANGLVYAGPHDCACYIVAKQFGFNALSPEPAAPEAELEDVSDAGRLVKGPAYGEGLGESTADGAAWPTYRRDLERSGHLPRGVGADLSAAWKTTLGGDLTSVVVADGRLLVAAKDTHTVHCLDAGTGERLWEFTAGGRVDSPPTVWRGRAIFGCADGRVYCLRAADGELVWKFRAAPVDRRTMAFESLESVWPVHGSVLVKDGVVHCVAGRSAFLDGGLRYLRLDAKTGKKLTENVMDRTDPTTGKSLQAKVRGLNMPPALPDILSSKADRIYMRAQEFDLEGRRTEVRRPENEEDQQGEAAHLMATTGFLDDAWFHRSYWFYGKTPLSGAGGYYRAGRHAPAGRIMVFDDSTAYSYGRKPQYLRWTTPMEYHLFAAARQPGEGDGQSSLIEVAKSPSLDPTGEPLTVEAWVRPEGRSGVIAARGGAIHGYSLFLRAGRPAFALRVDSQVQSVSADGKVPMGEWVHLAGVVTPEKRLRIYVNGKPAGTAKTSDFIVSNPGESMQVGADDGGAVGDYGAPMPFKGLVDELRVYEGALQGEQIRTDMSPGRHRPEGAKLVLYYSFDDGKPSDLSGNENHGEAGRVKTAKGRYGRAVEFAGVAKPGYYQVPYKWTRQVPLHVRSMVLAGDVLFAAGPPDLVDEEQAVRTVGKPETRKRLERQEAAWRGKHGALLWVVSSGEGKKLAEYRLDSLPAWDAMAAAEGRLYLATLDGAVLCWEGE